MFFRPNGTLFMYIYTVTFLHTSLLSLDQRSQKTSFLLRVSLTGPVACCCLAKWC